MDQKCFLIGLRYEWLCKYFINKLKVPSFFVVFPAIGEGTSKDLKSVQG